MAKMAATLKDNFDTHTTHTQEIFSLTFFSFYTLTSPASNQHNLNV